MNVEKMKECFDVLLNEGLPLIWGAAGHWTSRG